MNYLIINSLKIFINTKKYAAIIKSKYSDLKKK